MTFRLPAQIPDAQIETIAILIRADAAGATHGTADQCQRADMRFSFGYELTEPVRAAILKTPDGAWIPALDQDDSERSNGQVVELRDHVELSSWPAGSSVIVRRERPHPGAQLSFTDHDGYRFQAILTDQPDPNVAVLERRNRQRARVEDRIRDDKDTGLSKLPFQTFALNEVWIEIVMLAHDLIVWTQALCLDGEPARAEQKRLRYRLLHIAARLAFSARRAKLHLPAAWPWTEALKAAFEKLNTLPAPVGAKTSAAAPAPAPPADRPRPPATITAARNHPKPRSTRRRALPQRRSATHSTPKHRRQPAAPPKSANAVTPPPLLHDPG